MESRKQPFPIHYFCQTKRVQLTNCVLATIVRLNMLGIEVTTYPNHRLSKSGNHPCTRLQRYLTVQFLTILKD